MRDTIIIVYISILLPIMGFFYNAPYIINLLVNGVLFIVSISILFLIYFYEKENGKYIHTLALAILYSMYNILINPFLGIVGILIFFFLYNKYRNENYDLSDINSIAPITLVLSKFSKVDYLVIVPYFLILIFLFF